MEFTDQRTRRHGTEAGTNVEDDRLSPTGRIILVLDNRTVHSAASLYEAFSPADPGRLTERLEIHDTFRQRSWFNMSEIAPPILSRECLDRPIESTGELREQVAAREAAPDRDATGENWRFTTADARIKLRCLYP